MDGHIEHFCVIKVESSLSHPRNISSVVEVAKTKMYFLTDIPFFIFI